MITSMSTTITSDLLEKIDRNRGDIPRSKFVRKLLESALNAENEKKIIPADNRFETKDQQVSIVNGVDQE